MLEFSPLNKTWLIDIDGTIVKHNGHKQGGDVLLEGVKKFFEGLNPDDKVILLTSREKRYSEILAKFLRENNIKYDDIIYSLPFGERILINNKKTSGIQTAFAINKDRDGALDVRYSINEAL